MTITFTVIRHRQENQKTVQVFVSSADRTPTPFDAINFAIKHPELKNPAPPFRHEDRIEMRWTENGEEKLQLFQVEAVDGAISISPFEI